MNSDVSGGKKTSSTLNTADKRKRDDDDSLMGIEAKVLRINVPENLEDGNSAEKRETASASAATKNMGDSGWDGRFVDERLTAGLLGGTALQSGLPVSRLDFFNNASLDAFGVIPSRRELEGAIEFSDAGAAVALRTQALVAHQRFHAARAAVQLRNQALLLQNPTTTVAISRGREFLLGEGSARSNILANLHGLNSASSALFPNPGNEILPTTFMPLPMSRNQWTPAGAPPTPLPSVETKEHPAIDLYMRCDDELLSDHQILLRKQIEYFEAGAQEVESITHGRRREIQIGQVGIRCKHCAALPPRNRPKGSVYYPATLRALYQAAQNMAASHFTGSCEMIGQDLKSQFQTLQGAKASAGHGGKRYWSDCARAIGLVETETCLVFKK